MPSNNKAQRKRKQKQNQKQKQLRIEIQDFFISDDEYDIIKSNLNNVMDIYPELIFTFGYADKDILGIKGQVPRLYIYEYNMDISLTLETTIDDIVKRIEDYRNVKKNGTSCLICNCSLSTDTPRISHKGCNGYWCGKCYIHQFRKGYGVIKCNDCNYKIGNKHPNDASMFMSEMQIRKSLNMSISDPLH